VPKRRKEDEERMGGGGGKRRGGEQCGNNKVSRVCMCLCLCLCLFVCACMRACVACVKGIPIFQGLKIDCKLVIFHC